MASCSENSPAFHRRNLHYRHVKMARHVICRIAQHDQALPCTVCKPRKLSNQNITWWQCSNTINNIACIVRPVLSLKNTHLRFTSVIVFVIFASNRSIKPVHMYIAISHRHIMNTKCKSLNYAALNYIFMKRI